MEESVRKSFEYFFESSFSSQRTKWLKLQNGYYLELDGYNELLKIAFEVNGSQHYVKNKLFHSFSQFKKLKRYDKLKKKLCIKNNVNLIIIPYYEIMFSGKLKNNIPEIIKQILKVNSSNYNKTVNFDE